MFCWFVKEHLPPLSHLPVPISILRYGPLFTYAYVYFVSDDRCFSLGVYLVRVMSLGSLINRKYRNLSVVLTEQINLYLQIEQKPHKKDRLVLANNVLKLASDLLKVGDTAQSSFGM